MEVIDYRRIIKDIAKNGYDVMFSNEFPQIKDTITKIKQKPTCGSCVSTNIPILFEQPEFKEKLKLIYGEQVEYNYNYPKNNLPVGPNIDPRNSPPRFEFLELSETEFKKWWEEVIAVQPMFNRMNTITTYYKPETQTVVVSITYGGLDGRRFMGNQNNMLNVQNTAK